MEDFFISITVGNIYFSDHNAARIIIENNFADFPINP